MKKIMGIRTPRCEPTCRYVCIDDFETNDNHNRNSYYLGTIVYDDNFQRTLAPTPYLRRGRCNHDTKDLLYDPICWNRGDTFEKPTLVMYTTLGRLLRENGLRFNKKKGIIEKIKDR